MLVAGSNIINVLIMSRSPTSQTSATNIDVTINTVSIKMSYLNKNQMNVFFKSLLPFLILFKVNSRLASLTASLGSSLPIAIFCFLWINNYYYKVGSQNDTPLKYRALAFIHSVDQS